MLCCRCKENEGTLVHSKRLRVDGTYYVLKYCRPCQARRVFEWVHRKADSLESSTKTFKYSEQLAKESYLRISKRYSIKSPTLPA